MKTVNMHEAKTHLSRLVEEDARGEDIVIAKAGRPIVRLVPVTGGEGLRPVGGLEGRVREAADCWEPDPQIAALFYGEGDER
jgi:prevent-host-death family protein